MHLVILNEIAISSDCHATATSKIQPVSVDLVVSDDIEITLVGMSIVDLYAVFKMIMDLAPINEIIGGFRGEN